MPFNAAELRSRAAKQRFNVLRTFNAPAVRFKRHDVPFKVQGDGVAVSSLKFQEQQSCG